MVDWVSFINKNLENLTLQTCYVPGAVVESGLQVHAFKRCEITCTWKWVIKADIKNDLHAPTSALDNNFSLIHPSVENIFTKDLYSRKDTNLIFSRFISLSSVAIFYATTKQELIHSFWNALRICRKINQLHQSLFYASSIPLLHK